MNLTSDMEKILNLREKREFPEISQDVDTYWENTQLGSDCLFEADIKTPIELVELYSAYIDSERARVMASSSFKCKNAYEEKKKTDGNSDVYLPEFVYNF